MCLPWKSIWHMEALKDLPFFFFFCGYGNQHGKILTSNDFMRKEIPMAEWVACASAMGRSWITSCCILVLLIIYEASYIQYWGCIG